LVTCYLLSGGEKITDNCSLHYQNISQLIKLRNEVAHSKEFFSEVDVELILDEDGNEGFSIPEEVAKRFEGSPLISPNIKYLEIYESIDSLYLVLNNEKDIDEFELFCPI